MDTGVISAAFGALTQERRFEVIANNLANADTAGFKRDRISFADLLHPPLSKQPIKEPQDGGPALIPVGFGPNWEASRVRTTEVRSDLVQGEMIDTGNPLDLAIEGSGFFKLKTPQGVLYTRRGSFALTTQGLLVSQEGYPVLGAGGKEIRATGAGAVSVGRDGTLSVGGEQVGTLEIAQFPEGAKLEKAGDCLFTANGDPGPAKLPYTVRQGSLEMSNVNAVEEMVAMIESLRTYEAYQKVLQAYGQIDSRSSQIAQVR